MIHHQLHHDARDPYQAKTDGPAGHTPQQQGVENRNPQIPNHRQIELGFATDPRLELERHLSNPELAMAEGEELIKKLEASNVHLAHEGQTGGGPQGKEAAHVIGELAIAGQAEAGHCVGPGGVALPLGAEPVDFGSGVETTANHQVNLLLGQGVDGAGHGGRLMLAVAIHHQDQFTGGIKDPLLDGAREAIAAHPPDQTNTAMALGQLKDGIGSAISGVVVDKEDFKIITT